MIILPEHSIARAKFCFDLLLNCEILPKWMFLLTRGQKYVIISLYLLFAVCDYIKKTEDLYRYD